MIAYPDTSFLVSLYVRQIHSPRAAAHFAAMQEPLHTKLRPSSAMAMRFSSGGKWTLLARGAVHVEAKRKAQRAWGATGLMDRP